MVTLSICPLAERFARLRTTCRVATRTALLRPADQEAFEFIMDAINQALHDFSPAIFEGRIELYLHEGLAGINGDIIFRDAALAKQLFGPFHDQITDLLQELGATFPLLSLRLKVRYSVF